MYIGMSSWNGNIHSFCLRIPCKQQTVAKEFNFSLKILKTVSINRKKLAALENVQPLLREDNKQNHFNLP